MNAKTLGALAALLVIIGFLGAKKMSTKNHTLQLSSTSFTHQSRLPIDHTCEGKDISPQLSWSNVPAGVKSFALICDDPDAPAKTWLHWTMFNIPATVTTLAQGVATTPKLANGACQGITDFGRVGFGGACPPKGHGTHHYIFTLYALDALLNLEPGISRAVLENAMKGHILATGQLIGTYSRE
jgi:Raf kinase inhibitor-like YbhB/YbcL family protein